MNKINEQNRTRDMETRNILKTAKGEGETDSGEKKGTGLVTEHI